MEVSVIGSSQAKIDRAEPLHADFGFGHRIFYLKSKLCFGGSIWWPERSSVRLTIKATSGMEPIVLDKSSRAKSKPNDKVRLYVRMPIDAVSECNAINHARAISAGLRALKLLGVDGVEIPVWWGVAERQPMGKYNWSGYLALVEMVEKAGLKVQISLNFHASSKHEIHLPEWVSQLGVSDANIFFTDRSGKKYKDCLSSSVDELPILSGKTPIQVYGDFAKSFKSSFSHFLGSTITGISIGLGPDGELRYPSHQAITKNLIGVGEFQCYDKNMLNNLKIHAETSGKPMWGLSGPHDAPSYDHTPNSNTFVKEQGGSWESQYGDFFLSWYSSQLISHGDRLLSLATSVFSGSNVELSGKLPLIHSWYKTRSHPYELTSGFYSTENRNGYEEIMDIFARHSCTLILPGMDLSDNSQPTEALSSPDSLLAQITATCQRHGVKISGQNSSVSRNGIDHIKKNLLDESKGIKLFTYQRMGAQFFGPDHFPRFTEFVRSLSQMQLDLDETAHYNRIEGSESSHNKGKNLKMQTA